MVPVQLALPLGSGAIDVAFGERMALRARQHNGQTGVRVKLGASVVDEVVDYEKIYRLCYIRGPEGILIGLAQELGQQTSG